MSDCPDIALLEDLARHASPELIDHVTACVACQGVLALFESHGSSAQAGECARAEVYLAERATGSLSPGAQVALEAHLAGCDECRELASDVSGTPDLGDSTT
jgi:hypothetical protein